MITEIINAVMYSAIFLSLFVIDYALGNGFLDIFQKIFCKIACFIKKSLRDEATHAAQTEGNGGHEFPVSLPVVFIEIMILTLTIAFLKKYKNIRGKDRIDDLLHESKEALRQTNEFLEKWRLRRVPNEFTYLDDEPQEIKPLKLEVPILHMAIVDTRGTSRCQPERGDAGDAVNLTNSTLLSVTSLMEDDLESFVDPTSEDKLDENRTIEFRNRYLWDVMEEDSSNLDEY